jgi:RimJ/RimL family protein N-acetyltransferase
MAERRAIATESLLIRPIAPDDKEALVAGFERLGEVSRYRRFLSAHARLSDSELRYFTEVDHHDHEALVAIDPDTGRGVGVARFVRSPEDPTAAEFAIAVVDDWQRNGVGSRLAFALAARAREEGITTFTATVFGDNDLMLALARDLGEVELVGRDSGTVLLAIELRDGDDARGSRRSLRRLLRSLAAGELRPASLPRPGR